MNGGYGAERLVGFGVRSQCRFVVTEGESGLVGEVAASEFLSKDCLQDLVASLDENSDVRGIGEQSVLERFGCAAVVTG